MGQPIIKHHKIKYKEVAARNVDDSGGVIVSDGETVAIYRFRANGANPDMRVALAWDWGGADEKIFASTVGDIDIEFDVTLPANQITGDGVKSLKIVIVNDNGSQSPFIGGEFRVIKV